MLLWIGLPRKTSPSKWPLSWDPNEMEETRIQPSEKIIIERTTSLVQWPWRMVWPVWMNRHHTTATESQLSQQLFQDMKNILIFLIVIWKVLDEIIVKDYFLLKKSKILWSRWFCSFQMNSSWNTESFNSFSRKFL